MSDITKCTGLNCPIKESCYRFYSTPDSMNQSWFIGVPGKWDAEDDQPFFDCEMYSGSSQQDIMNTLKNIVNGKTQSHH